MPAIVPILRVTKNTIFKSKPVQSTELPGTDKVSVAPQDLPLRQYELEGNHYRVELENPLWKRTDWYVFTGHAEIEAGATETADPILVVEANTVFKTRLELSTNLNDDEKANVFVGEYALKDYEDVGNHLKVQLAEPIDGRVEWYVFEGHISLLNVPDYPPPQDEGEFEVAMLVVTVPTVFKAKPVQSVDLPDAEKLFVSTGGFAIAGVDLVSRHYRVRFKQALSGRQEWFVFEEHAELKNTDGLPPLEPAEPEEPPVQEPSPAPSPAPTPPSLQGKIVTIPGYGRVGTLDPILPNGNFFWGEATKNGTRIPTSTDISRNIVRMAERMEEVRSRLGNRVISVTSWYRDPVTNRRVGGARNSTHLRGYAVDFVVSGLSPRTVQRQLDPWWNGGLGYGRTFTHLDDRGYRARWNYS